MSLPVPPDRVCALVLAAGAARRFGSPKALAELHGKPVLQHVLDALTPLVDVTLVLGAAAGAVRAGVTFAGTIVVNDRWQAGLSSSLQAGLADLRRRASPPQSILVALGDQPAIGAGDYARMLEASTIHADRIIAASFGDQIGVPCIFPRTYFDALEALQGDRGARELLQTLRAQVHLVPTERAGLDVDTERDLADLAHALTTSARSESAP